MKSKHPSLGGKFSKVLLVIIVIIASFLAAFIGQLVLNNLSGTPSLLPQDRFIIQNGDSQRVMLAQLADQVSRSETPSFIEIYASGNGKLALLAKGMVLTNDGWVLAQPIEESRSFVIGDLLRVQSGDLLPILEVLSDAISGLRFARVDSTQLRPVTLAASLDQSAFAPGLVVTTRGQVTESPYLGTSIREDLFLSSDIRNTFHRFQVGQPGDFIYQDNGELSALIIANNQRGDALAFEANYIKQRLNALLRSGSFGGAFLGIEYIDLAQQVVSDQFSQKQKAGALITTGIPGAISSVLPLGSVGKESGLQSQDIILSVNGEVLTYEKTLSSFLLGLNPGDELELGVLRDAEPFSLVIKIREKRQ